MFRRVMLACTLALALAACNGGGGDLAGPTDPGPAPQDPGPQPQDPPPPPPPQNAGITGTYQLTQINSSTPGQLVTIANPDGIVIGLYRFDASTTFVLDPLRRSTCRSTSPTTSRSTRSPTPVSSRAPGNRRATWW